MDTQRIARQYIENWCPDSVKDYLADLLAEVERLQAREKVLADALKNAYVAIEFWGSYASDYFKDKHNLAQDMADARAALEAK